MTDRALLELAAKAAGYEYECTSHTGYPENDQHQVRDSFGTLVDWNPLTDDGDALRLAVKLRLVVDIGGVTPRDKRIYVGGLDGYLAHEPTGVDIDAATRRAIVRAAADIGKGME
jgi:hypothetical protein